MAPIIRSLVYASVFVGLVLVFLPARVLEWSGVARPPALGIAQIVGAVLTLVGGLLALLCVITFAVVGRGTPAPFDPPRRLVIAGPYRFVRNPMYIGAGLTLIGVSVFYESLALLGFVLLFLLVVCAFILLYEEPTLRRMFGAEYDDYCARVNRWLPRTRVAKRVDRD